MKSAWQGNIIGFFPTVENYLTTTDIPKAISLVERRTYFNEKYLGANNLPLLLMKGSI